MNGPSRYPAYRESGELWLGQVPRAWGIERMKVLLRERSEKGHPDEPLLAATQTKGVVRKVDYENRTVVALKDLQLLKLVREGDFVISLRSFQGGIEYARDQGIISPAYTILYPRDPEMRGYLAWVFKSQPYVNNLSLYVTGIRQGQNIDYERLSRSRLPVPPPPEQAAIAHFLDHADRRIRRYIAARRKLMGLLEEQRQTVIQGATTCGLDPSVALRPSGVEWLGDVPEHWSVVRATAVCDFLPGKAHEHFMDPDGEFLCATARFVSTGGEQARRCSANFSPAQKGDVLMVMSDLPRGRALARAYHVSDDRKYAVNQRVCALRAHSIDSQFLAYYANRNPQLLAHDDGSNQTHLPNSAFKTLMVPVPPPEEQHAIVAALASQTRAIDRAITRGRGEIKLVMEYRRRLIADVATGRLDVRAATALTEDAASELEREDEGDGTFNPEEGVAEIDDGTGEIHTG